MNKLLLSCLVFIFSYNAHASEKFCSTDRVATNAFNNSILIQERSFNDSLKKSSVYIESDDDYIHEDSRAEFDDCGALLTLRSNKIIKSKINANSLVNQIDIAMDKKDGAWLYSMVFKIDIIEQDGAIKNMMTQEMKGEFLTGSDGRINKSEDTSTIPGGKNDQLTQAVTTFLIDDKGRLSESNRLSTLKNDSVKTVYDYDDQSRLIKIASDSTTVEFTYGNDNRELGSKKVQKLFTTETTDTTCKEWNEFGRCTHARQDISILIKNDKDGKDHTYNHLAGIKYDYVY